MPHRGGPPMGTLTDDMKRVVSEQKLGFCATVCPDWSPNLSPKESTSVWDDDHLFFADICSPQTTANLRAGSLIAVNVVDPFASRVCTNAVPAARPPLRRCYPDSRNFPTGSETREVAWARGRREKRIAPSSIFPYRRAITSRA